MQCLAEKACSECPRLLVLPTIELLRVVTHSSFSSPLTILPSIRKIFPAVSGLQLVEVVRNSTAVVSVPSEEGFQIVSVEDCNGEQLVLTTPLSLSCKKATEWMEALERAMRYSLACYVTYSLATLPSALLGKGNTEEDSE